MDAALSNRVRIGEFELDQKAGELRTGDRRVRLQEQPFKILLMLVERAGDLVTRDEIKKKLWPNDTVVEFDHSIHTAINKLRQAFGDSANDPRYIETVARRGYRLMVAPERVRARGAGSSLNGVAAPAFELFVSSLSGMKVSHYRVLELLGGGGMGVVYKAEDLKLGRRVALKFLPEEIAIDRTVLDRFEREARAASALEHPNICAIYEFGEHEGRPFIAMPFLEGETLRDRIAATAGPFATDDLMELAIQIGYGLAAAHEKGIIHRDIKPANIFITHRGEARILDFGLAKLTDAGEDDGLRRDETGSRGTVSAPAHDLSLSLTGVAMGTAPYMSPEQLRGEKLDVRTDLYSFGLVIYEMATGRRAFSGETTAALHEEILNRIQVPARELNPELPPRLEEIINKALEKDRERRYQTAAQMCDDLSRLRRETEATRHAVPAASDGASVFHVPRRHGRRLWLGASLAVVACALVAGWLIERSLATHRNGPGRSGAVLSASSPIRIIPLTSLEGAVWDPALSPDAKKIAFGWNGGDLARGASRGDLYVQLIGGVTPLRLTHIKSGYLRSPAWSPDGREIVYGRCDDNGGSLYVVPALGGSERKLTDVACSLGDRWNPTWTSDGKSLVLADSCVPGQPRGIVRFSLETGEKRCLSAPSAGEIGDLDPALSPDQKTVAFVRMPTALVCDIYTVPLAGGELRRLTDEGKLVQGIMWTPDGQSIAFRSTRGGLLRGWRVPATGGAIEPETVYPEVGSLSRDGRRLVYVAGSGPMSIWRSASIWRADLSRAGGRVVAMKPLLSAPAGDCAPQLSPDGREIVFQSFRSASGEIWKSAEDGGDPVQLTSFGGHAGTPRWSADGRWIAFDYRPETHSQIYLIDAAGRNLKRITSGNYENEVASWARDGASIYFASNRTGDWQVWRHELASGREVQVTHRGGFAAFESYDARTLYYSKYEGGGIWRTPVAEGPVAGEKEQRITDVLHLGFWGHFAVTEAGLYLVNGEAEPGPSIMYYSFQTRRLTPVITLKMDAVSGTANLAASRDGRTVFFAQGEIKSSIVMAENLR